jgi:glycosyltransferase involved in cell wall biosynthesis
VRVAWCTPFWRESAIAAVSRSVAEAMARLCTVEIFHPPTTHPLSTELHTHPLLSGGDADCAELATFDVVAYCMGDNLPLHRAVYEASQRVPGIVVMHDVCMHHFFSELLLEQGDLARYLGEIERLYGREARDIVKRAKETGPLWSWRPVLTDQMPMFELAIRRALGVVTHSEFARTRVQAHFMGPTAALELPYATECSQSEHEPAPIDDRLLVLGIGHVNPNKRVDVVLEALAADGALAERVRYVIAGSVVPDEHRRLDRLVHDLRLEGCVELRGRVSDSELDELIHAADICINLRHPALEAASASLVNELHHGKAVIVTDTGCYAEVPDDCVVKTDPDDEAPAVLDALRRLTFDPDERARLGRRASAYSETRSRPDGYAQRFLAFADEALAARPLLQMADALGAQLRRLGVSSDMALIRTVAEMSDELFAATLPPSPA